MMRTARKCSESAVEITAPLQKNGNRLSVFTAGSENFRLEPLRFHDQPGPHKVCATKYLHARFTKTKAYDSFKDSTG